MSTNQTAIITGASRGIGHALSIQFAKNGVEVYAVSRNEEKLRQLVDENPSLPIHIYKCDLTEEKNVRDFVAFLAKSGKKVDYLINNAGTLVNKPFAEITPQELHHIYNVNVFSPFLLVQTLLPHFAKGAHIVNISSMGGFQGSQKFPGLTAYSSSKSAISGLTECLQEEFKDSGLVFNALCLGAVQTEMLSEAFPGFRAPVNPEQMADFIYHFSTTAKGFIRGKIIPVSSTTP